jgi:hypothetical protein
MAWHGKFFGNTSHFYASAVFRSINTNNKTQNFDQGLKNKYSFQ